MSAYVVAQLRFTDEAAYRRYQSRFADVFAGYSLPTKRRSCSKESGRAISSSSWSLTGARRRANSFKALPIRRFPKTARPALRLSRFL
jgi:hypothetical protein